MKGLWNGIQKLGFLLILLSVLFLLGSELLTVRNRSAAEELAARIEEILPGRSEGDPENYSDTSMPVLEIGGEDICGLIQVPSFGVTLPIGSNWGSGAVSRYPCRFWGSVYDNSLILGGSSGKGQFDFCGKLDLGDRILVTDMTGAEFSYETVRIDRRKQADMETFGEAKSDLVLFTREDASGGYIIIRCELAP